MSKYYINRKLTKMKTKRVLKMENNVAYLTGVGKSLKRTAPENLNVFFHNVNFGFGRWMSFLCLIA